MEKESDKLHSHSGLERELKLPKHIVLVDVKFVNLFMGEPHQLFTYNKVKYIKVDIMSFVRKGGVFKNLLS